LDDVFGLVAIVHEAVDIPEQVGRIADVEEVQRFVVVLLGPANGLLYKLAVRSRGTRPGALTQNFGWRSTGSFRHF
jgi:hypothetical protein